MSIFIGGAWPYANGSLHIGHIASLLPGDLLARYYRLKGERVLYVSGSDCNGTPISIRARQENVDAAVIADRYHNEFSDCFRKLGFTYDCYTRTDSLHHHRTVQEIFLSLLGNGALYEKESRQAYCGHCEQFLPDRYVEGVCPSCSSRARGDQCDVCSAILDPLDLIDKECKLCGHEPEARETAHYYFSLSSLQSALEEYALDNGSNWRENAVNLTNRYLAEGLQDRCATRDLPIGVPVPVKGYEKKKIYVWIEAVSGYLSSSRLWAEETGEDWKEFWKDDTSSYYVHGKDNIPFHTIIWPGILTALGGLKRPEHIISSEYVTLEKRKLSTSQNWAVWAPDLLERYHPDSIRYFLIINGPEKRDTDFSWREFIHSHNGELLGAFGNLVNRTLKFIEKSFGGTISGCPDSVIEEEIKSLYIQTGALIESGHFKAALETILAFIRHLNKYFDEKKPWISVKQNKEDCEKVLFTCTLAIANLSVILQPFLPFSCLRIQETLNLSAEEWAYFQQQVFTVQDVKPLFERIDPERIDVETERLLK
ncbi:methionine--tRNA ligase [Metabacillus indicus]|uniref:Methionine--tRNA ligase n=1 Tax=Metabacillus indicus TaxID=246786 RepID=A0A084GKV5_METID|nr:methionine--tRNA ligase [Metabacillus indicus]KEZ47967.1 methionyl-tRNA synthetase [Metabacillus indicus]